MPVVPVTNVSIAVAIGGKWQRIKRQILLPVNISGELLEVRCLIVPGLNQNLLFGSDFLSKYKANINYAESVLCFSYADKEFIVNFDKSKYSDDVANVKVCTKDIENNSDAATSITKHKYSNSDFSAAVEKAPPSERQRLFELLKKFENVFSECPGRVKSYEHNIEMTDESPFNCASYPIPFVYRTTVKEQIKEMLAWGIIQNQKRNIFLR